MPDDTYWNNTRADLRDLVEQQLASMLAGLIRGFVDRRDDKRSQYGAH